MSAIAFLNLQAQRRVPRVTVESRALYLARHAIELGQDNPTLRETVKCLCASDNAAVAHAGFALLATLRMK